MSMFTFWWEPSEERRRTKLSVSSIPYATLTPAPLLSSLLSSHYKTPASLSTCGLLSPLSSPLRCPTCEQSVSPSVRPSVGASVGVRIDVDCLGFILLFWPSVAAVSRRARRRVMQLGLCGASQGEKQSQVAKRRRPRRAWHRAPARRGARVAGSVVAPRDFHRSTAAHLFTLGGFIRKRRQKGPPTEKRPKGNESSVCSAGRTAAAVSICLPSLPPSFGRRPPKQ